MKEVTESDQEIVDDEEEEVEEVVSEREEKIDGNSFTQMEENTPQSNEKEARKSKDTKEVVRIIEGAEATGSNMWAQVVEEEQQKNKLGGETPKRE
ncbi:hypothetical protein LXL04_015522 [Taraxacum kok-saghyz]